MLSVGPRGLQRFGRMAARIKAMSETPSAAQGSFGSASRVRFEVPTDRVGETLSVFRPACLPGTEFWHVRNSDRHWQMVHDTFTACLVLEPTQTLRAEWQYRSVRQQITAGQMQLMEPGEAHRTTYVSEPASFFVVFFKPGVIQEAAVQFESPRSVHLRACQVQEPRLLAAFRELHACLTSVQDPFDLECQLSESALRLLEASAEAPPRVRLPEAHQVGIRRARACLEGEFRKGVSLDALAKHAGMSKHHFARSFSSAVGLPPHRYLLLLRLRAAQRHIEAGESIAEAATLSGFADHSHFTRKFRKLFGFTPSTWAGLSRRSRAFSSGV